MWGGLLQQNMLREGGESGLAGQHNSLPHYPMGGHQREWRSCSRRSLSTSLLTVDSNVALCSLPSWSFSGSDSDLK